VIRILIPVIALLVCIWFIRSYRLGSAETRKRLVFGFFFVLLLSGVIFLTLTGRLHFIAAVVTAMLPFAKKALPLLRYVPLVRRWVKVNKQTQQNKGRDAGDQQDSGLGRAEHMTRTQALEVLGLTQGANEQEIIEAHKRLMQKFHPDRGGNDFLAAQLNQAKDTLLS